MRKYFLKMKAITLVCLCMTLTLNAKVSLEITRGQTKPITVAMVPFAEQGAGAPAVASELNSIIENDLAGTGLFEFIPSDAFLEKSLTVQQWPRFQDWRLVKAQILIFGTVSVQGDQVRISYRVFDVNTEEEMTFGTMETPRPYARRLAHSVADAIYERLTGEGGYFDTRIAYISEKTEGKRRIKRLALMDQDGANHLYLTDGKNIVLTPRFSPSTQMLTYLAYHGKQAKVYVLDIETGKQSLVGQFEGMTFAPRFSPDGSKIIMSQALHGNSHIFTMDLKTHVFKQLTKGPSINTSPSYSPDGTQIVYNSDVGGSKQLYVMPADGSAPGKRISFGGGTYSTPVWSPRGDLIAFTKTGGGFYIGVMKPDGSGERLIAKGYIVEGPTWTPNGRLIAFTRQERGTKTAQGKSKTYVIDLTGNNERELKTPLDASDPAWSPLLPKS